MVLGIFLLAAAGLKAHGLAFDPLASESILFSPRLQIATIEVEILLGLWLLSGWSVRAAFVAAAGFFGILASVSLFLALAGQQSCGCFGRIPVNPWLTFALDIGATAALVSCRPGPVSAPAVVSAGWLSGLLKTAVGTGLILVVTAGTFLLAFDNPADALARLRGESLTVEPSVSQVGARAAGEERTFTIHLRNHTDRPIRVIGGTIDCLCITTKDLPVTLLAGETRPINVEMTFRGGSGRFKHAFVLYTDQEKHGMVVASFAGRVIEAPSP